MLMEFSENGRQSTCGFSGAARHCAVMLLLMMIAGCGAPTSDNALASRLPHAAALSGEAKYKFAVSIYAGWMPWYYANNSGILKKWAEREGIEIEVVDTDYLSSIEAFCAGKVDACLMTNMEALDLPAANGVDTTVLIVGDYSNGNDKILTRGIDSIAGLKGVKVSLVESSVSEYLLNHALEQARLAPQDVELVNTGESTICSAFLANANQRAVVTWNPIAIQVENSPGVRSIYDSSKIPGEILDLCVVNTQTLRRDPRLGRALVGTWYEVLDMMQQRDAAGQQALAEMAKLSNCSGPDYSAQLKTTFMFWQPTAAAEYAESPELKRTMESVRKFCFAKGLFGENAKTADDVGILYPDTAIQGNSQNVKLRFDASFVGAARKNQ